jgi:hypothetical protein
MGNVYVLEDFYIMLNFYTILYTISIYFLCVDLNWSCNAIKQFIAVHQCILRILFSK